MNFREAVNLADLRNGDGPAEQFARFFTRDLEGHLKIQVIAVRVPNSEDDNWHGSCTRDIALQVTPSTGLVLETFEAESALSECIKSNDWVVD